MFATDKYTYKCSLLINTLIISSLSLSKTFFLYTYSYTMGDVRGRTDPAGQGLWTMDADPPRSYALSGKIMLTAIIILFAVVVFLVILHLYARWYIQRVRRRYLNRRRSRRQRATHLIFYVDHNNPNGATLTHPARGLDAEVLNSLPVFIYSKKADDDHPLECAVCLSEFEENEKGRNLPKCNHSFHTECIDMWFESHSTCPLCRSPVDPVPVPGSGSKTPDVVISVRGESAGSDTSEHGSSSGFCSTCQHEGDHRGTGSLAGRRKGLDMAVEVPRRSETDSELRLGSPSSSGYRSPGARLLSLKRILSMNRRGAAVSPSSGVGPSRGPVGNDSDIESGRYEMSQLQTRAQTPR